MPPNPFSEGLSVQVSGDSSGAQRALDNVQGGLLSTKKAAIGLGAALAGALAAKGLGAAIDSAREFEESMIEVQKVTDEETAANMAGRMRDLATEIPVAAEELAELAADAARFGVRGEENIQSFTVVVAKMATATDMSTQQAGESFARLATLTETPVDEMENMGSAVNELSNNMATSSSEIVDSMLRSSAALSQFGLNNTEIIGMSAALNEVSESSRRAGTRLRRVAQELMNPRKVGDIADALGMTTDEFKTMRRERPARLMMLMAEAFAEGGDEADALRKTLSTASRQAIAGMAANLDGLREAMDMSNRSFKEGTSLQEEFDAATQTFNSRLQVLKNNLNDIAITVGNQVLPVLNPLLENVNDLISGGEELSNVLGEDTTNDLSDIGIAFQNLIDPVADNAEEIFDLSTNLFELGGEALPLVTPALRDLRFVLVTTASALDTINQGLEDAIELWNSLPPEVREGAIRGVRNVATAPVGGPGTIRGFRGFRRGINEQQRRARVIRGLRESGRGEGPSEVRIVLDERTDVIDSRIESGAQNVVVSRTRGIDRNAGGIGG